MTGKAEISIGSITEVEVPIPEAKFSICVMVTYAVLSESATIPTRRTLHYCMRRARALGDKITTAAAASSINRNRDQRYVIRLSSPVIQPRMIGILGSSKLIQRFSYPASNKFR